MPPSLPCRQHSKCLHGQQTPLALFLMATLDIDSTSTGQEYLEQFMVEKVAAAPADAAGSSGVAVP